MPDQIIDACCLINLYASGKLPEILAACEGTFSVSDQVRRESLSIRQPDEHDPSLLIVSPINLDDSLSPGLIQACQLHGPAELESYIQFAALLDDGEACCLAIAKSRGWTVATDDRKAIRIASECGIAVITTPELIARWAQTNNPTPAELVETLRCIERFANFRPRRTSPFHNWWVSLTQTGP
jgi:hypothetical protein